MPQTSEQAVTQAIGLCKRAGAVVCGTELICTALHGGKPMTLVLTASDASAGTLKRITDKCTFYHVQTAALPLSTEQLAQALGSKGLVAAVGITQYQLARLVTGKLGLELQAAQA